MERNGNSVREGRGLNRQVRKSVGSTGADSKTGTTSVGNQTQPIEEVSSNATDNNNSDKRTTNPGGKQQKKKKIVLTSGGGGRGTR